LGASNGGEERSVGNTYYVPVLASKAGTLALRTGRLRSSERIGIAFTSEVSFRLAMGWSGRWVRLDDQALKAILAPLGVEHFRVDPRLARDPTPLQAG
jgi:hypothetical protein